MKAPVRDLEGNHDGAQAPGPAELPLRCPRSKIAIGAFGAPQTLFPAGSAAAQLLRRARGLPDSRRAPRASATKNQAIPIHSEGPRTGYRIPHGRARFPEAPLRAFPGDPDRQEPLRIVCSPYASFFLHLLAADARDSGLQPVHVSRSFLRRSARARWRRDRTVSDRTIESRCRFFVIHFFKFAEDHHFAIILRESGNRLSNPAGGFKRLEFHPRRARLSAISVA